MYSCIHFQTLHRCPTVLFQCKLAMLLKLMFSFCDYAKYSFPCYCYAALIKVFDRFAHLSIHISIRNYRRDVPNSHDDCRLLCQSHAPWKGRFFELPLLTIYWCAWTLLQRLIVVSWISGCWFLGVCQSSLCVGLYANLASWYLILVRRVIYSGWDAFGSPWTVSV